MSNADQASTSTQSSPLVSVVIPCYNVEDYIVAALDSVLRQTHQNWEILCVDDGSTDDTLGKIMHWRARQEEIRFSLVQQPNSGACTARNKGLSAAEGKYVQFLDADDRLRPKKIAHQVQRLEQNPDLSFVAGAFARCPVNGDAVTIGVPEVNFLNVFYGRAGITSSNLFRRDSLEAVSGWNENLRSSQEADLMFRLLLQSGPGLADNGVNTEVFERDEGQISKSDPVNRLRNYIDVRTSMVDAIQEMAPEEWDRNRKKYLSFIVSTLLLLNRHHPEVWREYSQYIPFKSELVPIAGLTKKNIRMIRLMGYTNYFKLAGRLKPKEI